MLSKTTFKKLVTIKHLTSTQLINNRYIVIAIDIYLNTLK